MVVNSNEELGKLIDRIITDNEYDISMAETLVNVLFKHHSDKLGNFDKAAEPGSPSIKDMLMETLIAIPMNECQLSAWHCIPIFASNWGIYHGEIEARGTIMYLHNAARSIWIPFTRGIGICDCKDGSGTLSTYTYINPPGKGEAVATFLPGQLTSNEKLSGGISWWADNDTTSNTITAIEVHPTASTSITVRSNTITLVQFDGNNMTNTKKTLPGYLVDAVINMPVNLRAKLLQYMNDKNSNFTFREILTRALQKRLDTEVMIGIYEVPRRLLLGECERVE
jgi:hypothetical protein